MPSERPPQPECHLVAVGATTGVGGSAAVSMAAVRASVTRTERVTYGAGEEDWSHAVRVGTLTPSTPDERCDALLGAALAQIVPAVTAAAALRVHAWHSGPARAASLVARQLRLDERSVSLVPEHGAAGLMALGSAWTALCEQRVDVAVVSAACVQSDPDSLARGRRDGRVLGGSSSFGTVPGEAAAALVLASDEARQRFALASRGRLLAVAHAEETTPFGGPRACVGEGLVRAIRGVLSALPAGERARVFCNLNGERERTDEWGFALPRLSEALATPGAFVTPIGAFGDVENASGLLLIGLASALSGREGSSPAPCLIWTSSREQSRAAALYEPASPGGGHATFLAPRWARELDDSVLAELADEASFRYDQRLFQYSGQAGNQPQSVRPAVTRIEAALDATVQGLVGCGPRAWDLLEATLQRPTPGVLYTAARVLFEAQAHERAADIIVENLKPTPASALAARLAIQHAPPLGKAVVPLVEAWLGAGPRLAPLALWLAAHNGLTAPLHGLRTAGEAFSDDAVDETADWLAALSCLGQPGTVPLARRWQLSPHERLRRGWANATLCLDRAEGREAVLARAQQDPAVILPAALCVDAARAPGVRKLASALSGTDACLALGLLGDALAVPHLIECLNDPARAEASAVALELLIGVAPGATRVEAMPADGNSPSSASERSRDADAWRELARSTLEQHPPHARLRSGRIATAVVTLELMDRVHLPLRIRRYLARELTVRWGRTRTANMDDLLRDQAIAHRAISQSLDVRKVASWD